MSKYTQWTKSLAPAAWLQTLEPSPRPRTLETNPLSWLDILGLMTPQIPGPVVPRLRQAEVAVHTSNVDVGQQLLG
jgi:hypothetical protein